MNGLHHSLPQVQYLYPDFRGRLVRAILAFERGKTFRARVTHGLRTFKKQGELYAIGRTVPGELVTPKRPMGKKVTNAKPGSTTHNYGLGADICMTLAGDPYLAKHPKGEELWLEWGECVESEGLVWGGRWAELVDKPHAQITYGMDTKELLVLFTEGGIEAVWSELDRRRGITPGSEWRGFLRELLGQGFGKGAL